MVWSPRPVCAPWDANIAAVLQADESGTPVPGGRSASTASEAGPSGPVAGSVPGATSATPALRASRRSTAPTTRRGPSGWRSTVAPIAAASFAHSTESATSSAADGSRPRTTRYEPAARVPGPTSLIEIAVRAGPSPVPRAPASVRVRSTREPAGRSGSAAASVAWSTGASSTASARPRAPAA